MNYLFCTGLTIIKDVPLDKMSCEEIERLKENTKRVNIWKLTADLGFAEKTDEKVIDPNLPFEVKSSVKEGTFTAFIQGRMDTITAPQLLKQFQEAGAVKGIRIDVSRMAYVSSAGLRVLLKD